MSEMRYARDAYGEALIELGEKNKDIVVLDADLSGSTRTAMFGKKFPERFFNMGVAEQNMMGTAAGLAASGKIAFASTFAIFGAGRAWDQVRNTICYNQLNVKIVVTHAGITVGPDGSSHQAIEDIALMRAIPNMNIIVPCDAPQTKEAIFAASKSPGPVYIRLGRAKIPTLCNDREFEIGRARVLRQGDDVSIIACGIMVRQALLGAEILEKQGINARVVDMHTIRPLDKDVILECANKTKGIVTCEEHLVSGGLGSAVAEVLAEINAVAMKRVGIPGKFGQSGDPENLIKEYRLTPENIAETCKGLIG
ncbi:MAG: transketolase family protein [Candidatus Omnitrophica bacterium]|nr:transketolase family protein [Candidatus Omnitrophota bacterium]